MMRAGSGYTPPADGVQPIEDEASGLKGVIAIDSLNLGPAMGGCRFWRYDTEEQMTGDAIRLARGMSYKNALAGLPMGGGKSVIQVPDGPFDRAALFKAFGEAIERLGGAYITAEDVGTTVADMQNIRHSTRFVAGLAPQDGKAGGDPSPWTALGVFLSLELAAKAVLGRDLSQLTIAIQGAGAVGSRLAGLARHAGARVIIADTSRARAEAVAEVTGGTAVDPDAIVGVDADIFAPCALGGAITADILSRLKVALICGAANNQIASDVSPDLLTKSGIAYMPDYLVNAGGIINAAAEYLGEPDDQVEARVRDIPARLASVLQIAEEQGKLPHLVADEMAEAILRKTEVIPA